MGDDSNASEAVTPQQCDQQCPETGCGMSKNSCFPSVETSVKKALNSSLKNCIDMSRDPITAATDVEQSVNKGKCCDEE